MSPQSFTAWIEPDDLLALATAAATSTAGGSSTGYTGLAATLSNATSTTAATAAAGRAAAPAACSSGGGGGAAAVTTAGAHVLQPPPPPLRIAATSLTPEQARGINARLLADTAAAEATVMAKQVVVGREVGRELGAVAGGDGVCAGERVTGMAPPAEGWGAREGHGGRRWVRRPVVVVAAVEELS